MQKSSRKSRDNSVVGVCWYLQRDWERVRETALDPDLFEDSFNAWAVMAKQNFALIAKAHPGTRKVMVDADEFFNWCHLRGAANNSQTRAEYAASKLRAADAVGP